MAVLLAPIRYSVSYLSNGVWVPLAGGKVYAYEAGTSTPKDTYTTSEGNVANTNPVVLNARGEASIYLGTGRYKIVVKDANDNEVIPAQDNIPGVESTGNSTWCGTAGGTADAITLTPDTAITTYEAGQIYQFAAASANTGAVTVAISGLATKAITWNGTTALAANDIVAGRIYQIQYDGTRFQLLTDPAATDASDDSKRPVTSEYLKDLTATTARAGLVELATDAETQTGTDTARAITPANLRAANVMSATAQATTSGTTVDFTSIPSWVKKITVMLNGVSTNGTSAYLLQLGDSGGIEATGYTSTALGVAALGSTAAITETTGFLLTHTASAALTVSGICTLALVDSSNTWAMASNCATSSSGSFCAGKKALSATLDRVRLTTVSGDTFDAGSVNILYE